MYSKVFACSFIFCVISIAAKEEYDYELSFVGNEEVAIFTSDGGEFYSFIHNFRILVPPNAVPCGSSTTVYIRGCCHGPFQLPPECKLYSDIIFVIMKGIEAFQKPVQVEISHNLVMEEYKRCHQVSILRCEYENRWKKTFSYPLVFNKIAVPDVSDTHSVFSFYTERFCGLCAAYEDDMSFPYLKLRTLSDRDQVHCDQNRSAELVSPSSKFDNSHPSNNCSKIQFPCKRPLEQGHIYGGAEKQLCQSQYILMCYWPLCFPDQPHVKSMIMFVIKDCFTSIAVS